MGERAPVAIRRLEEANDHGANDHYIFRVFCPKCGAVAQEVEDWPADSNTRGGAVRNWNERPHIIKERYTKPEKFRHEEDMEEEGSE